MIKGCFENKVPKLSSKIKRYFDTLFSSVYKNWFRNLYYSYKRYIFIFSKTPSILILLQSLRETIKRFLFVSKKEFRIGNIKAKSFGTFRNF